MPQLALAWCLNNPDVSAVRSEFQSVEEVETLVKAVEVKAFLTRELELEIEDALKNLPTG